MNFFFKITFYILDFKEIAKMIQVPMYPLIGFLGVLSSTVIAHCHNQETYVVKILLIQVSLNLFLTCINFCIILH